MREDEKLAREMHEDEKLVAEAEAAQAAEEAEAAGLDADAAIRMCLEAGYPQQALELAQGYGRHELSAELRWSPGTQQMAGAACCSCVRRVAVQGGEAASH